MTRDTDDYGIRKPLDRDYIGVEKRRADISTTEQEDDNMQRDRRAAQHPDMSSALDVGGGNGAASAVDDLIDKNAVSDHDGRAPTRTFFYTVEAPKDDRQRWKRLYRHQEGVGDPERGAANREADQRRAVDTFCGQLDMSPYHKERIKHIMDGLNMSHMAHYSSEKVILGIISLVANEDNRFIRDEKTFRELMRSIETDLAELKSVRQLIRRKSERL